MSEILCICDYCTNEGGTLGDKGGMGKYTTCHNVAFTFYLIKSLT